MNLIIGDKPLTLERTLAWIENPTPVSIHPSVRTKMLASRKVVDDCLKDGKPHYGINTGFESLANTKISEDKLDELQYNLVRSHACGVGEPFPEEVVRLMTLLRANVLAMGYSGVRYELLEFIVDFINKGKFPKIPSQGSVGASGDLAPLAHLALAFIENGLKLEPKEGLALINGIQSSLSVAVIALGNARRLFKRSNDAAALAVEGLRGSAKPFDSRIADARGQRGHEEVSKTIRDLIKGSKIIASHKGCSRVQDPYSLRCVPQVHGAVYDSLEYAS